MKSRVLIAGGGVAALEAALALRDLAGERAAVELFSPRRDFVYRPYAVGVPYGAAEVARYDLERLADLADARFHLDSIASVNPTSQLVVTHDGESFSYDYLVIAAGAQLLWPVPGAITFWGVADETDVEKVIEATRKGALKSVAFTTPAIESWSLPLYELALLASARLARDGVEGVRLTVVTPEEAPLQVFGRAAAEQVEKLLDERGIELVARTHPVRFEGGKLTTIPAAELPFDAVVSLPKLEGRRIRGVRHDPEGFIRVDERCRVLDQKRLFAVGDVTSFPVKQGGIAAQQADVAAAQIAAELGTGADAPAFDPLLRGVLWTGSEPRYLQGWIGGGHGEGSTLSAEPPWGEPADKIVARRLSDFLAGPGAEAKRSVERSSS
jgi:sulfide:quinone oxidoreductase